MFLHLLSASPVRIATPRTTTSFHLFKQVHLRPTYYGQEWRLRRSMQRTTIIAATLDHSRSVKSRSFGRDVDVFL